MIKHEHAASIGALLAILLFAGSWGARAQDAPASNVLVARGVLSRTGKAGTLWTLAVTDDTLRFRDGLIRKVTFVTPIGDASRIFAPYDGRHVELAGEVKTVFDGNAVLSAVRTIGIIESLAGALSPLGLSASDTTVSHSAPTPRVPYRYAYYLFVSGPSTGCEPCYVPLLITQDALEDIARSQRTAHGVWIVTYERDSIWERKGVAPIDASMVDVQRRTIHMGSRSYRYQAIVPTEVLQLLEHPLGAIPTSRPSNIDKTVPGASVEELIADFRAGRRARTPYAGATMQR